MAQLARQQLPYPSPRNSARQSLRRVGTRLGLAQMSAGPGCSLSNRPTRWVIGSILANIQGTPSKPVRFRTQLIRMVSNVNDDEYDGVHVHLVANDPGWCRKRSGRCY